MLSEFPEVAPGLCDTIFGGTLKVPMYWELIVRRSCLQLVLNCFGPPPPPQSAECGTREEGEGRREGGVGRTEVVREEKEAQRR